MLFEILTFLGIVLESVFDTVIRPLYEKWPDLLITFIGAFAGFYLAAEHEKRKEKHMKEIECKAVLENIVREIEDNYPLLARNNNNPTTTFFDSVKSNGKLYLIENGVILTALDKLYYDLRRINEDIYRVLRIADSSGFISDSLHDSTRSTRQSLQDQIFREKESAKQLTKATLNLIWTAYKIPFKNLE